MAVNVGAMLMAFLALIALTNGIMGGIHNWLGGHGIMWFPASLQQIFGWVFAPVAWVIGVPWHDCVQIGNLLGTRMVLNELVAFSVSRADEGIARSAVVYDRDVCAVRLCEFQFDRNADRRDRRARARIRKRSSRDSASARCSRAPWRI